LSPGRLEADDALKNEELKVQQVIELSGDKKIIGNKK